MDNRVAIQRRADHHDPMPLLERELEGAAGDDQLTIIDLDPDDKNDFWQLQPAWSTARLSSVEGARILSVHLLPRLPRGSSIHVSACFDRTVEGERNVF
jgi:hypothetical protein